MKQDERDVRRQKSATETDDDDSESGKLQSLKAELDRVASGATLALEIAGLKKPTRPPGRKSLALSGILSFLLGPFGWLYAAPLKEAIPVILAYAALGWLLQLVLPSFLLMYLVGIVNVASGVAGALYAWGHNSAGKRVPLLLKESDGDENPAANIRKLLSKKK